MTTPELKPCPKCGQSPKWVGYQGDDDGGYGYVECGNTEDGHFCGVHADNEAEAIAAWNTHPASDVGDEVERHDGSLTLDNASVQRLLDYGVLHYGENGWFVAASQDERIAEMREALVQARAAIASLDEFALGGVDIPDTHTGESVGQYGVRDELLAFIDATLRKGGGE